MASTSPEHTICSPWVISELYKEHRYLLDSDRIDTSDKEIAKQLEWGQASMKNMKGSLMLLTRMMQQHYGKPVILLIDEYDVPVAKANNNGYYNEMLDVMKGLMQALKDNPALRFAVVTGCLKIAKESIFTGTNNFVSDTITNSRLNEYFGFVQSEVNELLKAADMTEQAENMRKMVRWLPFRGFRCLLSVGCHELYAGASAQSEGKADQLLEKHK